MFYNEISGSSQSKKPIVFNYVINVVGRFQIHTQVLSIEEHTKGFAELLKGISCLIQDQIIPILLVLIMSTSPMMTGETQVRIFSIVFFL